MRIYLSPYVVSQLTEVR